MSSHSKLTRRSLIKKGGGVGLAAGVSLGLAASVDEAHAYDPGKDERRARYRSDAADVQAFYRTNGYETLKNK